MITSTISNTKNRLSELLARVQSGETLIIVDGKTPVAGVERIRGVVDNPHVLPAVDEWDPSNVLKLPVLTARKGSLSLVRAVGEEREAGW
jgi:hypothetical protein